MAKTLDDFLKTLIGDLVMTNAQLAAMVDQREVEIVRLRELVAAHDKATEVPI